MQTGGETIADAFGAAWDVTLGRKDTDNADPEGRLLPADASPEEVKVSLAGAVRPEQRDVACEVWLVRDVTG